MNIRIAYLTQNPYSRPGTNIDKINALIMHWTANPGLSAMGNRNYWEGLKNQTCPESDKIYASAHYVISDSEIVQCLPENEKAYHCGSNKIDPASGEIYTDWAREMFFGYVERPDKTSPNRCTLAIELCPIDDLGRFGEATLDYATSLAADICIRYKLDPLQQIGTHHMVVGWKNCPLLWTEHQYLFDNFKNGVAARMEGIKC